LQDGTLAHKRPRPESVWADDMYMGVPLLAQTAAATNDKEMFDDAAKQVIQINEKLFIKSKGLYTHGWASDNIDNHPYHYWGRANGWCAVAVVELLDLLPEDHPARPQLVQILRAHAQGIAETQSGVGMWRQVMDRPDSYLETSCTAMFSYALAKGVNHGWLDAATYGPVAIAGWDGLMTKVSEDGHLSNVCIGTNYAEDFVYYYHRPAVDDMHGYGPVILAGSEMIKLVKNEKLRITVGGNAPITVTQRK
jgi:unsaturated rhamnogalacturonyl hydrolase